MRQKTFFILVFVVTIVITSLFQVNQVTAQNPPEITQEKDFARHFNELDINGSIIIYDNQENKFYQHNASRNKISFAPASTYKIPNSLIALETGVIKNDVAVLTWDGITRGLSEDKPIAEWNQDLNLRLAFKYSAVWFYQVLARKIGYQRMQDFVKKIQYGNQNIGSAEKIDRFWLEGELKITPEQQIEFLRRLYKNDLPFSVSHIELVKDIMIMEKTPNYTLRGKTGWATFQEPQIGWLVGYLEQNNHVYFFATSIDMTADKDPAVRLQITRLCLQDLVGGGLF